MPNTVRICGVDYPDCCIVDREKDWGIQTPRKIFRLSFVCDQDGQQLDPLPDVLPREIRRGTFQLPDLTKEFPETVKRLFNLRRAYCKRVTTLHAYRQDDPGLASQVKDEHAFQRNRKRMLSESLQDFARSRRAREDVWKLHGTRELADQRGYLGAEPDDEHDAPIALALATGLSNGNVTKHGFEEAWRTVESITHVMIYDSKTPPHFIYLDDMKEAARPQNEIERAETVAEKLKAAAGEVRRATEIGDLYSNPSMADAKNSAIKRSVPKEFVAYCHTEWHGKKFPSSRQAHKAVKISPLFKALRQPEEPSHTTVWRWLSIVREELENRGLLTPRGKGTSAKPVASYDVEKHPAPTLDDAEEEQARAGQTNRDTRTQELSDPQNQD